MVAQYDANVKALIAYLKLLKVKVNGGMVNETFQNHPDWPSLLCIGDSLHKWNIPYAAGKMYPTAIAQLPTPFLAYTNNRAHPLSVITEVTNSSIRHYSKNYNNPINESQESFLKNWTGVYLIAQATEQSGEKDFEINKRKEIVSSLIPASLVVLLVTLSVVFLYHSIQQNSLAFSITGIYLQYFISLIGMAVASMLLWYEVDKNNLACKPFAGYSGTKQR